MQHSQNEIQIQSTNNNITDPNPVIEIILV